MADNIIAFQSGREAAMGGFPRDARRNRDWLEGYDQTKRAKDAFYSSDDLPANGTYSAQTDKTTPG